MSATIAKTVPEVLNKPRTTAEPSLKAPLPDVVFFGPFAFDRANGLLSRQGVELSLPPRAVGVLARLVDRAGDLVPKAELLDHVWKDTFVTEVSLTEAISLLRQTLGDDPQRPTYIQTQPRRGYRFVAVLSDRPFDDARAAAPADAASALSAAAAPDPVWPAWLPWVVCGVLLFSLIAVSAGLLQQPGLRERPVARFDLNLDAAGITLVDRGAPLAISRDGTRIAFTGQRADIGAALFVRDLARLEATAVPGASGARAPFFSPDGRWVGFFAKGRLFKAALAGGAPIALCDAPDAYGAVWTEAGSIIFGGRASGGLRRVSDTGGRDEVITTPDVAAGELRHAWPSLAADGRVVLFTGFGADGGPESARLAALSLDSGDVRTLVQGATFGRALDTGHLLFVRDGRVQAAPFDADALAFQGAPAPILDSVAVDASGAAPFAVAAAGALVDAASSDRGERRVAAWRWGQGLAPAATPFDPRTVRALVADASGARAAAAVSDGHRADVWTWSLDGGADPRRVRLSSDGHNLHPIWSPDGAVVVFGAQVDGRFDLVAGAASGGGTPVRLTTADRSLVPASIGRDGQLLYALADASGSMDIWRLDLQQVDGRIAGGSNPRPLIEGRGDQVEAAVSPDGRWLAWQSNASGAWRVLARDLGRSAADLDLGASAGGPLFWSGGSLAFQTPDDTAAIVRLTSDRGVERTVMSDVAALGGFVPARGGLLTRGVESLSPPRVEVVLEWTKELSAKVPVRPKDVKAVR